MLRTNVDFIGCDHFHCVVQYNEKSAWLILILFKKYGWGSAVAFLELVKMGMSQKQFGRFFGKSVVTQRPALVPPHPLSRLKSQRFKSISIPKAKNSLASSLYDPRNASVWFSAPSHVNISSIFISCHKDLILKFPGREEFHACSSSSVNSSWSSRFYTSKTKILKEKWGTKLPGSKQSWRRIIKSMLVLILFFLPKGKKKRVMNSYQASLKDSLALALTS